MLPLLNGWSDAFRIDGDAVDLNVMAVSKLMEGKGRKRHQ